MVGFVAELDEAIEHAGAVLAQVPATEKDLATIIRARGLRSLMGDAWDVGQRASIHLLH